LENGSDPFLFMDANGIDPRMAVAGAARRDYSVRVIGVRVTLALLAAPIRSW